MGSCGASVAVITAARHPWACCGSGGCLAPSCEMCKQQSRLTGKVIREPSERSRVQRECSAACIRKNGPTAAQSMQRGVLTCIMFGTPNSGQWVPTELQTAFDAKGKRQSQSPRGAPLVRWEHQFRVCSADQPNRPTVYYDTPLRCSEAVWQYTQPVTCDCGGRWDQLSPTDTKISICACLFDAATALDGA
jgi:hypothetical protein